MRDQSSATVLRRTVIPAGAGWGVAGVVAFSLTVPMTRIAVGGGAMSPLFAGAARAVIAALLAGVALTSTRQPLPRGRQWGRLGIVAGGVVAGFPLLTSYALTSTPAGHGAVVIALLPACTAVAVVLRTRERPAPAFWVAAALGAVAALGFSGLSLTGDFSLRPADLLLFAAVGAAAVGYAEGGLLARELGAWQTVSWALIVAAPLMAALTGISLAHGLPDGSATEWAAFGYLAVVSMFLGFLAWYRGLALGPMAQVSQVQLAQPVLTIAWAALLLHEHLSWPTVLGGCAVVGCALLAVRIRT